ncbi:MAG: hypothetical protein EXR18_02125 [Flavobacteriaceae bacterium]|nr:hypothetical protein [Flavobacteriaceae bacterium]
MNTIKLSATVFSFFTLMIFTSCNVEPLDTDLLGNIINPSSLAGTYRMTSFNTGIPTDLNNDGTASTNQMLETSCFNNNVLIINPNATFTLTSKGVGISSAITLECYTDPDISGTWVLDGTVLTLLFVESSVQNSKVFSVSGRSLTNSVPLGEIVGTTSTNAAVFLNSSYNIIYTR